MKLKALARRVRRQAKRELKKERLSSEDYRKVIAVTENPHTLRKLRDKIHEKRLNPYDGPDQLMDMDWHEIFKNLWDWIQANWMEILKLILALAPLLLMEKPNEDS